MSHLRTILLSAGMISFLFTKAQDSLHKITPISSKYIAQVSKKAQSIEHQLDIKTSRLIRKWKKTENRIIRRCGSGDSLKIKALFLERQEGLDNLQIQLSDSEKFQNYIPEVDTIWTSLKLLQSNSTLIGSKMAEGTLDNSLNIMKGLDNQLRKSQAVKEFIKARKEQWISKLSTLPLGREIKKLDKLSYYYSQQINQYKALLKDRKKAEKKALSLLSRSKIFKDFMAKNSQFAKLFRLPANDPSNITSLANLQNRSQINDFIQRQVETGSSNARDEIQGNMREGQEYLSKIKRRIDQVGGSSSEDVVPKGFKPNSQRTKSFWNRLDVGFDVQSQKSANIFPASSDLGAFVGFKIRDNLQVGIGGSYRIGLGSSIRHIHISSEGIRIKSYLDLRLKKSFGIFGGYEKFYLPISRMIGQDSTLSRVQNSGLIGLSKVVSLRSGIFKRTKLLLLWDFLSYHQKPISRQIIFRVSYSIK